MRLFKFKRAPSGTVSILKPDEAIHTDFPDNWEDIAWDKLPMELKHQAVTRLQVLLPFESWTNLYADYQKDPTWHFGPGMWVRNRLRSDFGWNIAPSTPPIPDEELPPLPEIYNGLAVSTWDDFYIQVIECVIGKREIEL